MPHVLVDLSLGRGTLRNLVRGNEAAGEPIVFDFRAFAATADTAAFNTFAAYPIAGIPELQLAPRARFTIGYKPVEFPSHPRFSKRFMLLANDEAVAKRIFSARALEACEALPAGDGWQLQSGSGWLLVACAGTGEAQRAEVKQHGARIAAALRESARFRESFA